MIESIEEVLTISFKIDDRDDLKGILFSICVKNIKSKPLKDVFKIIIYKHFTEICNLYNRKYYKDYRDDIEKNILYFMGQFIKNMTFNMYIKDIIENNIDEIYNEINEIDKEIDDRSSVFTDIRYCGLIYIIITFFKNNEIDKWKYLNILEKIDPIIYINTVKLDNDLIVKLYEEDKYDFYKNMKIKVKYLTAINDFQGNKNFKLIRETKNEMNNFIFNINNIENVPKWYLDENSNNFNIFHLIFNIEGMRQNVIINYIRHDDKTIKTMWEEFVEFNDKNKLKPNKISYDILYNIFNKISCYDLRLNIMIYLLNNDSITQLIVDNYLNLILTNPIKFIRDCSDIKLDITLISNIIISVARGNYKCDINELIHLISMTNPMSLNLILKYKDIIDWYSVTKFNKVDETFINKYREYIDPTSISLFQDLTPEFIEENSNWLNMDVLYRLNKLPNKYKDFDSETNLIDKNQNNKGRFNPNRINNEIDKIKEKICNLVNDIKKIK